jgi:transglutaminase-like putative cysteine protease
VTNVSRVPIRGGDAGAMNTLELMAGLVNQSLVNPVLVGAARSLAVNAAPERDQFRQAIAVRTWLSRVWRFVDDPTNTELLRDPEHMLREYFANGAIAGDCDEAAILGAALGKAVGLGATFTVYAFDPIAYIAGRALDGSDAAMFSHVFASLLTNDGRTVSLDITKPTGSVPPPTRELTVEV